ncbi:MAG: alpha/beta hydrolase [Victivallales bacterium]|nr:alpha/beta hydrolase [Victivallales bacterium]
MKTLILPGWATPGAYYEKLPFSEIEIMDYGFFQPGTVFSVEAIRNRLKIAVAETDCIVVAHSLGSMFALEAAAELPGIKALVLFAPFARFSEAENYPGQGAKIIKAMRLQLKKAPERVLEDFMKSMAEPEDFTFEVPAQINVESLVSGLNCLLEHDVRGILDRIACPVLTISGSDDRIAAHEQALFMSNHIANCEYCEIDGAGHAVPFTRMEEYTYILNLFTGRI